MTGIGWSALLLAVALLVMAPSPRRRLVVAVGRRSVSGAVMLTGCFGSVAVAAMVLPSTTLLAASVAAVTLIVRRRRSSRRRRTADEGKALAGALEVLVGELRIGAHPVRAFEAASDETPGSVGAALAGVAARARLGADVVSGLSAVGSSSALAAEWSRMAVAWQLAAEHGMSIAALMRTAQTDIVERQHFWGRVQANMSGPRATAGILAGLPLVGVAMGQLIGADPVGFLVGGGSGGWALVVGTVLLCAGLWWADRIVDRLPA